MNPRQLHKSQSHGLYSHQQRSRRIIFSPLHIWTQIHRGIFRLRTSEPRCLPELPCEPATERTRLKISRDDTYICGVTSQPMWLEWAWLKFSSVWLMLREKWMQKASIKWHNNERNNKYTRNMIMTYCHNHATANKLLNWSNKRKILKLGHNNVT